VIVPAGEGTGSTPTDRRRVTRLDIFVNFIIRRVGTAGTVLQESARSPRTSAAAAPA
jgi:hypothetical protein